MYRIRTILKGSSRINFKIGPSLTFYFKMFGWAVSAPFRGLTFAPDCCLLRPHGNIVTNSSLAVGWMAILLSKSAYTQKFEI